MSGGAASAHSTKIIKPGYHIRPKYDLHGLRHRRTDSHRGSVAGELPLTSMIDMFAILVVYLLMNFSATGDVFFMGKGLPLPKAMTTIPMEAAPLLSIVGDKFVLDAPPEVANIKDLTDTSLTLDTIVNALKGMRANIDTKKNPGSDRLNIQASEDTELGLIKRAMAASVTAGFSNINFVVEHKH